MPVPTYDQFIEPILRCLAAQPDGALAKDVHERAAAALQLTEQDRQELLPSGTQPVYKNRAGWAHDRLKRAGLSSSVRRGFWRITDEGRRFVQQHPQPFPPELAEQLAMGYINVKLRPNAAIPPAATAEPVGGSPALLSSPDDRLGQALVELRAAAEAELRELLAGVSPAFFETMCSTSCTGWDTARVAPTCSGWVALGTPASTA